jgi:hypothetical protein
MRCDVGTILRADTQEHRAEHPLIGLDTVPVAAVARRAVILHRSDPGQHRSVTGLDALVKLDRARAGYERLVRFRRATCLAAENLRQIELVGHYFPDRAAFHANDVKGAATSEGVQPV